MDWVSLPTDTSCDYHRNANKPTQAWSAVGQAHWGLNREKTWRLLEKSSSSGDEGADARGCPGNSA